EAAPCRRCRVRCSRLPGCRGRQVRPGARDGDLRAEELQVQPAAQLAEVPSLHRRHWRGADPRRLRRAVHRQEARRGAGPADPGAAHPAGGGAPRHAHDADGGRLPRGRG
ncbi:unnamed protein product, partial [Prorocentrum cordatum]